MSRRSALIAGGALVAGFSMIRRGHAASGRVVIIGGGFGGATCAKYIKRADPAIDVTLIEANASYITCPFSNGVLADIDTLDDLTLNYGRLASNHGVKVVKGNASAVDSVLKRVMLSDGRSFDYDRLVISPGVDFRFNDIDGLTASVSNKAIPHAWKAGSQTTLLRRKLHAIEDGGTFIITVPPSPYRCPPAPYERASLAAYWLKKNKPKSKVLILDSNDSMPKQALFEEAWSQLFPGMVTRITGSQGGEVVAVDPYGMTVDTASGETVKGSVINIIPPHKAGAIAAKARVKKGDWCPVNPATFESTKVPGIHVIGDACTASPLPKSGAAANSQGKVCAQAIADIFAGKTPGEPLFSNACYSVIQPKYAIALATIYGMRNGSLALVNGPNVTSPVGASKDYREKEFKDAGGWYRSLVSDSFY
ncbi:MAG: NAD(P)/FAD-dependent oxidoreductase [Geminicoccaceae bacterium]